MKREMMNMINLFFKSRDAFRRDVPLAILDVVNGAACPGACSTIRSDRVSVVRGGGPNPFPGRAAQRWAGHRK
jgi:hypothetical protein